MTRTLVLCGVALVLLWRTLFHQPDAVAVFLCLGTGLSGQSWVRDQLQSPQTLLTHDPNGGPANFEGQVRVEDLDDSCLRLRVQGASSRANLLLCEALTKALRCACVEQQRVLAERTKADGHTLDQLGSREAELLAVLKRSEDAAASENLSRLASLKYADYVKASLDQELFDAAQSHDSLAARLSCPDFVVLCEPTLDNHHPWFSQPAYLAIAAVVGTIVFARLEGKKASRHHE